ncbi:DMT family transporter [Alphaproteobacteria bacterium]|nr:DMT family transporter [Alphaproteobacteria bacterium]
MQIFNKFPNLTVIVSCIFWGSYWIPLRYIDSDSNSSLWPIFFSFLLLSLLLLRSLIKALRAIFYAHNYYFLFGCFFAATGITFYSESLLRGEIAKVVVLFYLCPIWGTIFAKILLGNKLTLKRLLSITLGIIGLEIMVGIEKGIIFPSSIVEWIALSAGLSWALGMCLFHLAKSTNGFEKTALTAFIIPFVYLVLCFFPGGRNLEISHQLLSMNVIYFWMLLFAVVWLLPSILLTYFSVEILDPGRINILLAFEVVVGFISASLLTNEIISLREYLGALFVLSACLVDVFFKSKMKY